MHTALDWNTIYLTCFGIGLILSVVSFLTGTAHLHIGHFHFGHAHAAGAKAHHGMSIFNAFSLMAFLCWFGGTGYLLHRYGIFAASVVLGFAVLSGTAGASLLFWFLTRVIMPHERTLEPADTEMVGVLARVSSTVPPGGVGEVLYTQNGARRSVPVRSENGVAIPRDVEVVVMRYEHGVAYVRRWDEFEGGLMGGGEEQETGMREP